MQKRARLVKRIALGLVLILAAAGVTFIIKDLLAARQPENSLPEVVIDYRGTPLPTSYYVQESFSWRFITGTAVGHITPHEFAEVEFAPVNKDAEMEINFSYQPRDVVMSVAFGHGPHTEEDFVLFEEYAEDIGPLGSGRYVLYGNQYFYAPSDAGSYVIRVWADWGWRGSVLYYIKMVVVD